MSDYERNKGKLIMVCQKSEITEALAGQIVGEKPDWYDSCQEALEEDPEQYGHVIIDDVLWRLEREEVDDDPDYCHVFKNADGSICFETYHYNGVAHWTELLEEKVGRLASPPPEQESE